MAAVGTGRGRGTGETAVVAGSTESGAELPRWELRLAGLPVWCPGAATDGVPSSLGAAIATPVAGVPASATPSAKAAAPARAPRLFTDIGIPREFWLLRLSCEY